jgi:hypothetical protein
MPLSSAHRTVLIQTIRTLAPGPQHILRIQNIVDTAQAGAWNAAVPMGATFAAAVPAVVDAAVKDRWIRDRWAHRASTSRGA